MKTIAMFAGFLFACGGSVDFKEAGTVDPTAPTVEPAQPMPRPDASAPETAKSCPWVCTSATPRCWLDTCEGIVVCEGVDGGAQPDGSPDCK